MADQEPPPPAEKNREELLDDLARCYMEAALRKALAEHGIDYDPYTDRLNHKR